MKIAKSLFIAVFALLYCTQITESQHKRARDNYQYLHLLPKYDDSPIDTVQRFDFKVVMKDGTILDALKFIPKREAPPAGWPTVIFVHGYGDNKETLASFARAQAEFGYYTASFSIRGQGNSTGQSNLISNLEAKDMIEFVNAIKNDAPNGSNPNNILIMGGSQGGLIPYMACSMGMEVKTIISALAPPNFASSWIENGSIKMTLLWSIEYTPDTVRYNSQVDRMSNWIYANNKKYWDSLAFWLPQGRDFQNSVVNNKVPLIIEGSWQDKFFNASGIIQAASNNTSSPFKLYVGAVQGHGGDHSPTEDQWHMQFFNDWFLYWLFGEQNGILNRTKYDFAYSHYPANGLYWSFTHDSSNVPFSQMTSGNRLYFNTNGRLTANPNGSNNTRVQLRNQVTGGLTMQEAVNEEFTGQTFNSKFRKRSLTFTSSILTTDIKWLGTPKINLDYLSTAKPFVQFNFQIYEVGSDGTQKLINRVNYTDRNYVANSRRTRNFEGQAHGHIFKVGNRIRIIITNLDTSPDDQWFLGTNPFVLPVLNNGYHYVYLNKSYIDLPVVGASIPPLTDSFEESETPNKFSLSQNYPNPFNPVTSFKFHVPSSLSVKLAVFDVLGREIEVIVDERLKSGAYEVKWNASKYPSGAYFYRLTAGNYSVTKKLVIVK
ncbi:MAG: T9SS type A sorting domain-containing protein [Chlorobi bacterium]|nr:T9SS type A sorting domain-containing protein [Chlorobiota bacterium]MCI0716483.1 T9SS type A sorting domain-containing protein [Chlorobiota bacterium]